MTHYDGFQSRAIILRQTLDSTLSDDDYDKVFSILLRFSKLENPSKTDKNSLFNKISNTIKHNEKHDELIQLIKSVLLGGNILTDLTITQMSSTEVRQRDAERHTIIAFKHKYRYHSNENLPDEVALSHDTQILAFRLATLLNDEQHALFVNRLKKFNNTPQYPQQVYINY